MRFLPKSRSHDSEASVTSETCGSTVSGASTGTARARIARYGVRQSQSQTSPTHRDHAHDRPAYDVDDDDDDDGNRDDEEEDDDDDDDVDEQRAQSSRLLVCFDDAGDLKDTRV